MGLPTSFVHKKSCNSKFVIWGVAESVSQRLLTSRNGQVQTDARTDGNRGGRPLLHRPLPPPAPPPPNRGSLEISGTNCSGGGFEAASTTAIAARKRT